jgi:D-xylose transport system substrate-binding protein
MKKILTAAAAATLTFASAALAQDAPVVGVSWSNFQEERWKTDEAAIKQALEAAGALLDAQEDLSHAACIIQSLQ